MKKISNRMIRINEEIKRELSYIIRNEIKDPRVGNMVSVIGVETTKDLKYCKVIISDLGDEEKKKETKQGLKNAVGFIRKELARRLNLRSTPELKFIIDDSIEYSIHMSNLFKKLDSTSGDGKSEV